MWPHVCRFKGSVRSVLIIAIRRRLLDRCSRTETWCLLNRQDARRLHRGSRPDRIQRQHTCPQRRPQHNVREYQRTPSLPRRRLPQQLPREWVLVRHQAGRQRTQGGYRETMARARATATRRPKEQSRRIRIAGQSRRTRIVRSPAQTRPIAKPGIARTSNGRGTLKRPSESRQTHGITRSHRCA